MTVDIIILAAGKGTRMRSAHPKVLQPLAGKPLLAHVLESARQIPDSRLHVVIGHGAEQVKSTFPDSGINWLLQKEQLGTGHAVMQALDSIDEEGKTLVLYGDVPLVSTDQLGRLLDATTENSMTLLTVELDNPKGYGRIIRTAEETITAIVEEKDATSDQKQIRECNSGILAIDSPLLKALLPGLDNNNAQQEYYLTDLVAMAGEKGSKVNGICVFDAMEVQGVNNRKQLSELERLWQTRQADDLMEEGVTLIDPARLDIRGRLKAGRDVTIDINCIFEGDVTLGDNVTIAANCMIGQPGAKVVIEDNVEIKPNCIVEEGHISRSCTIGPFARIRPGTVLEEGVKVGNFVETKKSHIGKSSKVNHLSYIGDADIGEEVNVGAGTITCNYDGVNKHKTVIEDKAFIGSNTSLVAPVNIGKGATVGAGSTINRNVEDEELAVARSMQKNIKGWPRPKKK